MIFTVFPTLHIAPKAPLIIEQTTTLDHVFWSLRFSWIANGVCYHETTNDCIWIYWRAFKRVKEGCEELRKVSKCSKFPSLWNALTSQKYSQVISGSWCFELFLYIYIFISLYIYNYIRMFLMFHSKQLEGSRAIQEVDACHQHRLPRQVPLESTWSPPLSLALWAIPLRKSPKDSESHYMILLYNV